MKAIIVFGKRGQSVEDIDARLSAWTPKPYFFFQDMPDYVLDTPAIHDLESRATYCGADSVKGFLDTHVPRLKTRERVKQQQPSKQPEVPVATNVIDTKESISDAAVKATKATKVTKATKATKLVEATREDEQGTAVADMPPPPPKRVKPVAAVEDTTPIAIEDPKPLKKTRGRQKKV